MVHVMQKAVSKSEFKAKALQKFRDIETTGESIIVTDHGKPTIEVRRYQPSGHSPLDLLKGSVTEYLDPLAPVGEGDWESLK